MEILNFLLISFYFYFSTKHLNLFSEFWYSMDDVLGMGGQYMYYKYRAASKVHKVLVHGTRGVDTKRPITKCSMDLVQNVTLYFFFKKIRNFSVELPQLGSCISVFIYSGRRRLFQYNEATFDFNFYLKQDKLCLVQLNNY